MCPAPYALPSRSPALIKRAAAKLVVLNLAHASGSLMRQEQAHRWWQASRCSLSILLLIVELGLGGYPVQEE